VPVVDPLPTRVLVIRHGQSVWNAERRWQGQADPPLSDLGRQQALDAAERIGTVVGIVASDLLRASTTAWLIAERLGIGPVVTDTRLRERDAGAWTGLTLTEIDDQYPGWRDNFNPPAGFEPDAAVTTRVLPLLADLHEAFPGDDVLAVAHGGIIHALERATGTEGGVVANLAGRWFSVTAERVVAGDRVSLLDDAPLVTEPAAE
jgi:probable phosphoglycerate mutase